jgi:glycosyltransferase involved in cell wall biosynthesis
MVRRALYVYDGKMTGVGIDAVVHQQLQALTEHGCEVDLVARGRSAHSGVRNLTFRHTIANAFSWLPRRYYYPLQKRYLSRRGQRLCSKQSYDAVISWPQRALATFQAAQARSVPCFLNCDTIHFAKGRRKNRKSVWPEFRPREFEEEYAIAHRILAPSKYARETFLEAGVPASKVVVLGRGVDTEVFHPAARDIERPFRLLFCGRVGERKGIRQALGAWRLADLPNSEFWIVGEIADDVRQFVRNYTDESVKFLGFQKEPGKLMQQCDVQILLSRHEGMAKGLLEGAACGLATITTPQAGFPLQDCGYEVDREDIATIAGHLRYLQSHRDETRAMGNRAREAIQAGYSWRHFREKFLEAIEL